ncbi:MAG: hypothetical protein P8X64_07405 [Anaerolineales bacterium]
MERVPFFRRPSVLLFLGALFGAALYLTLQDRVAEPIVPRFMLFIISPFATLSLLYLGYRSIHILFISHPDSRDALSATLGFLAILTLFILNLLLFASEPHGFLPSLVIDLDLLLLTSLLMLLLCAQFVLPVDALEDRLAVTDRLLGHVLGERGPVTFVRNGQAVQAHGEDRRRGPGVFLVDHASAIVLRTDTAFTRAAGPGVIFSRPGERLAEAVDLRRQERSLVPQEQLSDEQEGRFVRSSLAITRDGIPVAAQLSITFMIDPGHRREPREGRDPEKPPFEFHAPSVERAVFGHLYGQYEDVSWNDLPLLLMADVWREEIKRWSMNELLVDAGGEDSILSRIADDMRARLIPTPEARETEGDSGTGRESDILAARGIRPIELEIRNLQPPPDVRRERLLQWHEGWYGEIQAALQEAREVVERNRRRGEAEAAAELHERIPGQLIRALENGEQPGRKETLLQLLQDARSLLLPDGPLPGTTRLLPRLDRMVEEIGKLDNDCQTEGVGDV